MISGRGFTRIVPRIRVMSTLIWAITLAEACGTTATAAILEKRQILPSRFKVNATWMVHWPCIITPAITTVKKTKPSTPSTGTGSSGL